MLPDRFWKREMAEDLKSKKALLLKFLVPLIFLVPLLIAPIPTVARASGFVMVILFVGIFGSAVRLARLRESRMLERLAVLPLSPRQMVAEYIGAHSVFDMLQLAVPLLIFTSMVHPLPIGVLWIGVSYVASIVGANALGVLVALMAGSSGEGHLYGILTVLIAAGLSGLFFVTLPDALQGIGLLLPFRYLVDAFVSGGAGVNPYLMVQGAAVGGVLVVLVFLVSPRLFRFA
jgi:ABC-type multidrug transport system permease subunit